MVPGMGVYLFSGCVLRAVGVVTKPNLGFWPER